MSAGLLFWILMILWGLSILNARFGWSVPFAWASDVLLWIVVALLGWHVFGAMLH